VFIRNPDLALSEAEWAARQTVYEQLLAKVQSRYADLADLESEWALDREIDAIESAWRLGQDVSTVLERHSLQHTLEFKHDQLILVRAPQREGFLGSLRTLFSSDRDELPTMEVDMPDLQQMTFDAAQPADTFEELCRKNPNYPRDLDSHRMYQKHLMKWGPLIKSNHKSIYSNWQRYKPEGFIVDPRWPALIRYIDKTYYSYEFLAHGSKYLWDYVWRKYRSIGDTADEVDASLRRDLMIDVFNSYVHTIENLPNGAVGFYKGKYWCKKKDIIAAFDRLSKRGYNPFDFYIRVIPSERKGLRAFLIVCFVALVFVLIWTQLSEIEP